MSEKTAEERLRDLEKKVDYIVEILGIHSLKNRSHNDDEIPPLPKDVYSPKESIQTTSHLKTKGDSINFLPLLAVVCFFLAAVFIVRLTIESGWLTPGRQWGLLIFFGLALTGFSLFVERIEKSYRTFSAAAGIVVLYIGAYSGNLYFDIFPSMVAIAGAALVSLLCFYLFNYFKSELFVVVSIIGTYITPIMLEKEADLIFLSAFFLIWAGVFARIAIAFKTRTITLLASYLGLAIFAFLNINATTPDVILNVILVQSMQFIIYAGGVYYYSVKNQDYLSQNEAIAFLPILLFFYGTIYYFLNIYNPAIAPWISLVFAGFIYLLYWFAKSAKANLQSGTLVQAFLSVVVFHSGYMQLIPAEGKTWLLPSILLAMYISEKKDKNNLLSTPFKILFFVISLIEFFVLCLKLLNEINLLNVLPAMATIGVGFFYYLKGASQVKNKEELFLSLLHIISILSLYRIAYEHGSLAVTGAWGVYSMLILVYGYMNKHAILAKSSLIVLIVTTLKALLYDASQASSLTRILSLALTGGVLYGAGYLFQKINKWHLSR